MSYLQIYQEKIYDLLNPNSKVDLVLREDPNKGIRVQLNQLITISINLLVFYHECRSLIGYATHYLFCDR